MPNSNPTNAKKNPSTLRSMMGFLSQKGRFATGTAQISTQDAISVPAAPIKPPITPSFSATPRSRATDTSVQLAAQSPDQNSADPTDFREQQRLEKELRVTANAARGLTSLFAGLSIQPGSGKEIPSQQRQAVIHQLIDASHQLTNRICRAVMGESKEDSPDYLRAMVLTEAAKFISKQWEKNQRIDIEALAQPVEWAVRNQIPSFAQDTLDLIDIGTAFTPATSKEVSQMKITNSIYSAQLKFLDVVEQFHVDQYDKGVSSPRPPSVEPFTYGRTTAEVTTDLLRCTLRIANENPVKSGVRDMDTMFYQNRISRAQVLVASQYRKITDAMLTVAFDNELESVSAVSYANSLYDEAIEQIEKRARENFTLIEKLALDVMGVENNPFYYRNTQQEPKTTATPPVERITQAEQLATAPARTAPASVPITRQTTPARTAPAYRVPIAKVRTAPAQPAPESSDGGDANSSNEPAASAPYTAPRPATFPRG